MNLRVRIGVGLSLALAVAFGLVACGGKKTANDPIPPELAAVETAAETGFDAALKADPVLVASSAATAASQWTAYALRATADGVPADALAAVAAAIAAAQTAAAGSTPPLAMARAFNRISAPMARIYEVYKPPVPSTLLDLDYLGRELHLDARAADMARVTASMEAVASRWTGFRPNVIAVGGSAQATQMDGTLTRARTAISANDFAALELAAVAQAEAVDVIEQLYASLDASD
jgi:hypothetical protein